jgi:2-methylcitrate dehydratase PrpD
MSVSERIGAAVAETAAHSVPASTDRATRRALLDALGVMLAATTLAPEAAPYRARALLGGGGTARLLGGRTAEAAIAALANGALAHALDYGDTYDAGPAHPNAALVPALLALADADRSITFGRMLAAMAAASDLACRLSRAPARPYEKGGWYPPPLFGSVAAAAGCAALLGLRGAGVVAAMGLAMCGASFPGEIKHDPSSGLRAVREGFAARAAVEASLLAQAGARGFAAPLEGAGGFFALYGGGGWREEVLFDALGERFLGDEVSFKPWPSCRGTHPYIEAALTMGDGVDLAAVERIEAETGPVQMMLIEPHATKIAPDTAIGAKFSIPYTVACALVDGAVTLDSFAPARLADLRVRAVAAKVVERRNPDWSRAQAASGALTVVLETGERREVRVMQALGHPDRPLSEEALVAKFVDCAARATVALDERSALAVAALVLDGAPGQPAAAIMDACMNPLAG